MQDAYDLRRTGFDSIEKCVRMDKQGSQSRAKFVAVAPLQQVLTQPLGA